MQDDGGDVLGNLPRSRPGRRSEKRTGGTAKRSAAAKGSGAAKRSTAAKKLAKAKASTAAKKSSSARKPAAKRQTPAGGRKPAGAKRASTTPPPQRAPAAGNPVEDAVRAATKVAETGLRVASGVTREVLRRLPRP